MSAGSTRGWRVVIQRQYGPPLTFGPYPCEAAALSALERDTWIDAYCQDDCLDAWAEPQPTMSELLASAPFQPGDRVKGLTYINGTTLAFFTVVKVEPWVWQDAQHGWLVTADRPDMDTGRAFQTWHVEMKGGSDAVTHADRCPRCDRRSITNPDAAWSEATCAHCGVIRPDLARAARKTVEV